MESMKKKMWIDRWRKHKTFEGMVYRTCWRSVLETIRGGCFEDMLSFEEDRDTELT